MSKRGDILMPFIRLSLFLMIIVALAACSQQEQGKETSDNKNQENSNGDPVHTSESEGSSAASAGIVAGKLEATLQVEGEHAIFKIKNQTEQVKELILAGKTSYEYIITNDKGKTVYQKSQCKPQYEQKHPITLKQAEEIEYELAIPDTLQPGTYTITGIFHTEPALKAKTTFTIEK